MKTRLQFYNAADNSVSDCAAPLDIEKSSVDLGWPGMVLEKGWSPHFYPENIVTPYFYFALALDQDLRWAAKQGNKFTDLKTEPGYVWFNPPGTPFSHRIDEACFFIILAIEADTMFEAYPDTLPRDRLQFLNNYNLDDIQLKSFVELLYAELDRGGPSGTRYVKNILVALSEYFINNYSNYKDLDKDETATALTQSTITEIEDYVRSNLEEAITVDDLAAEANMSKFYFLREFKKAAGTTPHQFITGIKMQTAKEWIGKPDLPLAEMAVRLGFTDQSHFSRVFKSHFGRPPGSYRKEITGRA